MELLTCPSCGAKYTPYSVPRNLCITLPNGKNREGAAISNALCFQCVIEAAAREGVYLRARLKFVKYPEVEQKIEKQITQVSLKKTWERLEPWKDLL